MRSILRKPGSARDTRRRKSDEHAPTPETAPDLSTPMHQLDVAIALVEVACCAMESVQDQSGQALHLGEGILALRHGIGELRTAFRGLDQTIAGEKQAPRA